MASHERMSDLRNVALETMVWNLETVKTARKLSVFGLAERCNVEYATLKKLVAFTRDPQLMTISRIASGLGVSEGELIGRRFSVDEVLERGIGDVGGAMPSRPVADDAISAKLDRMVKEIDAIRCLVKSHPFTAGRAEEGSTVSEGSGPPVSFQVGEILEQAREFAGSRVSGRLAAGGASSLREAEDTKGTGWRPLRDLDEAVFEERVRAARIERAVVRKKASGSARLARSSIRGEVRRVGRWKIHDNP